MKLKKISNHKFTWTSFNLEEIKYWDDKTSYMRYGFYLTPIGTVVFCVSQWRTRESAEGGFIVKKQTEFESVINGRLHRSSLPVNNLSERSLKIYATKFLKQILNQ